MKKYNNTKHSSKKIDSNRANEKKNKGTVYLTIGLYVSMRSSRYEARGKFEEHERCVIFNPKEKVFFASDLFADVTSVHNRNMKHARAIEFD